MSRFQDPYLAESSGFATGHSRGIAEGVGIGRQQGYTEGWNAAADEANAQLAQKDRLISELNQRLKNNHALMSEEIKKIDADRNLLAKDIFSLVERVKLLREKNDALLDELEENNTHRQEEFQSHLQELEQNKMAFLGVVSMARAAMKLVASASAKEQHAFIKDYAYLARKLQTSEYIDKYEFPHDQEMIIPHIPDILNLLKENIFPQVKSHMEELGEN